MVVPLEQTPDGVKKKKVVPLEKTLNGVKKKGCAIRTNPQQSWKKKRIDCTVRTNPLKNLTLTEIQKFL